MNSISRPKSKGTKGKIFEEDFKKSCQEQNLWIDRIKDNQLSYSTQFSTTQNKYDFYVFDTKVLYGIELKCTNLSSLTISRDKNEDKNKMIKKHQIDSLCKDNQYDNILCCFVINFKTSGNVYLLPIENFMKWYNLSEKKSMNEADVLSMCPISIDYELKRTRYRYNIKKGLSEFRERFNDISLQ